MTSQYQYQYDPLGTNPLNVVTDKPHPLTPVQGKGYHLIVPKAGPFFRKDFKLVHRETGRVLKPDVDFVFSHYVSDLSHALQQHVYGSVSILNKQIIGDLIPIYRTVGGDLVLQEDHFMEYAIHLLEADGAFPWDKLRDLPDEFDPPPNHEVPLETTAGYDELIEVISRISLGGDHMHNISHVRGLDEVLRNKLDSNGNYKVLTSAGRPIPHLFEGSVYCRVPKVKSQSVIKVKIQVTEGNTISTIEVVGAVKPYNDGAIPQTWDSWEMLPSYQCWDGDVYLTYDSEHYPVVVLGKNKKWLDAHVSILEHFAVDPSQIAGEIHDFGVTIGSSYTGIEYYNTKDRGMILTPATTEGQLNNYINRRYFGVMPEGIYQGFGIVQIEKDKIKVGNSRGRNAALLYDGTAAASVVMDNNAQILNVTGPQESAIVIELMPLGTAGDDRIFVDLPDREAQIRIVNRLHIEDNMLVIGHISWPSDAPELAVEHLTYEGRQNAAWDSGTVEPIRSDVVS